MNTNKEKITVLGLTPGEKDFHEDWETLELTDLESMQKYVEGNIDCILLPMGIDLWFNDDFLSLDSSFDTLLLSYDNPASDQILRGNVFLASVDQHGNTISLSVEQLEWISANTHKGFLLPGLKPMVIMDICKGGL